METEEVKARLCLNSLYEFALQAGKQPEVAAEEFCIVQDFINRLTRRRDRINWRHPLEHLPENRQKVFYIDWHWKRYVPGSYQIIGGTFYKATPEMLAKGLYHRVEEDDEHGGGSYSYNWPTDEWQSRDSNFIGAWVPAEEIDLPEWLTTREGR
jgi:hypothetical protein